MSAKLILTVFTYLLMGQAQAMPSISAMEMNSESSTYFGVIGFVFKNKSDNWMKINSPSIDFGDELLNKHVKIVVGADLATWDANRGGKNLSEIERGKLLETSETALLSSGGNGFTVSDLNKSKLKKNLPKKHILGGPIAMAPGLGETRWLVVYTKHPDLLPFVGKLNLSFKLGKNENKTVEVQFRKKPEYLEQLKSTWQKGYVHKEAKLCERSYSKECGGSGRPFEDCFKKKEEACLAAVREKYLK